MREVKFRFWNGKSMYTDEPLGAAVELWVEPDVLEIMQYTGLKDKKGEEIYEGDITNNGIIRFGNYDNSYIGFYLEDREWCSRGGKKHHDVHDLFAFTTPFEVLGNIYENPDLLPK